MNWYNLSTAIYPLQLKLHSKNWFVYHFCFVDFQGSLHTLEESLHWQSHLTLERRVPPQEVCPISVQLPCSATCSVAQAKVASSTASGSLTRLTHSHRHFLEPIPVLPVKMGIQMACIVCYAWRRGEARGRKWHNISVLNARSLCVCIPASRHCTQEHYDKWTLPIICMNFLFFHLLISCKYWSAKCPVSWWLSIQGLWNFFCVLMCYFLKFTFFWAPSQDAKDGLPIMQAWVKCLFLAFLWSYSLSHKKQWNTICAKCIHWSVYTEKEFSNKANLMVLAFILVRFFSKYANFAAIPGVWPNTNTSSSLS